MNKVFKATKFPVNQKWFSILLLVLVANLFVPVAKGQASLTINECYNLARKNYPLIKQRDLIIKTKDYSVSNAAKGYLPAFSVNGQATYQSNVTTFPFSIPIKGFTLPNYSKDQYKIFGELDQTIYDGGVISNQKQNAEANEIIQQQSLEVQLYALYDRVNQLFFGALLVNEQLKQNDLLKADVQNGIDKAKALVANGTAYRSSVDELSAQILQTEQARVELLATKKAFLDVLGLFINSPLDENTVLEKPAGPELSQTISRPELLSYEYQKKTFDLQDKLLSAQLRPHFGFFAQGGYGRPGLNPLSNNFQWYYIGGLKLSWNLGSLYTLKNQRELLDISRKSLDIQKETFLFNTSITQKQQNADIEKYTQLVKNDDAIIALRRSVKNAASAQLENGVLSAHDYINEVNNEDQARQSLILHQMQLLQAQYSYQNTIGNIKN
ncbi:TolC family protein [Mucilaginibacter sp.]|uniref:TolC family protein n=1 Tax=Mucilaginibacter sp. TaxID=1882438 RepID=UPI0028460974|nr:TolC family protein [Mucilaginibacter sp.]MDR3697403.1 TolC family protein [Mucilaginibacter sp.]